MSILKRFLQNLKYEIKYYAGSHRILCNVYRYYPPHYAEKWVTKNTVICIEGFPRSGNTFAAGAFLVSNLDSMSLRDISSHTHNAMQIVRSAKLGIPCIAVIRDPISTLTSWLLVRDGLTIDNVVKHYIWFYRCVEQVADKVVLSEFTTVTTDFRKVIVALNKKYGRNFKSIELTDEIREKIFRVIRQRHADFKQPKFLLPIPSEERDKLKQPVIEIVKNHQRIQECKAIYEKLFIKAV